MVSRIMKSWGSGHSCPLRALGVSSILSGTSLLPALGRGRREWGGGHRGPPTDPRCCSSKLRFLACSTFPCTLLRASARAGKSAGSLEELKSGLTAGRRSEAGARLRVLGGALPAPGQLQTPLVLDLRCCNWDLNPASLTTFPFTGNKIRSSPGFGNPCYFT